MNASVYIDNWKLPIFKKALDKAGYKYIEHAEGPVPECMTLQVEYEDLDSLKALVKKTNKRAARSRMH